MRVLGAAWRFARRYLDPLREVHRVTDLIVEAHQRERELVLQRVSRLRLLCDVHRLDFEQMVRFAREVHEPGVRSWAEALGLAIDSIESLHPVKTLARHDDDDPHVAPAVLDEPSDALPYLYERKK